MVGGSGALRLLQARHYLKGLVYVLLGVGVLVCMVSTNILIDYVLGGRVLDYIGIIKC